MAEHKRMTDLMPCAWRLGVSGFLVTLAVLWLAGCQSIGVAPAPPPTPFDNWRISFGSETELSPRSRQTLRQFDLETVYEEDPAKALTLLQERLPEPPPRDAVFALAELSCALGCATERRRPDLATRYFYLCAGYAYHYLLDPLERATEPKNAGNLLPIDCFDPRFRLAAELYNLGLARCLQAAQRDGVLDPRGEFRLCRRDGSCSALPVSHHGFPWRPDEFGPLQLCSDFRIRGLVNHHRQFGLGVPLICTRRSDAGSPSASFYPQPLTFPVTAFFRYPGSIRDLSRQSVGQLELYNPLAVSEVLIAGWAIPLETDLTTPLAFQLAQSRLDSISYLGFFRGDSVQVRAGIYLMEPYDPKKIPVLFIHGLLSSPLTWAPLVNDLLADPEIRSRYQFWFYLYPTSQPFLASAADLRRRLAELRQTVDPEVRDHNWNRMVLIGHSMGGLISRLLTIEGGDDFWASASSVPIGGLPLSVEQRRELEQVYYFPRVTEVRRVVFLGTPHRGSALGQSALGRLARRLAGLPRHWQDQTQILLRLSVTDPLQMVAAVSSEQFWIPAFASSTSVDMLSPEAPVLAILEERPRPSGVAYHSVIGIAPPRDPINVLSHYLRLVDKLGDGVVPYASAHLPGADSELIVAADHMTVHQHPLAVAEVRRILLEHLAESR